MTPTTTAPPRGTRPTGSTGSTVSAISARGLRKSFGDQLVLDGIDLDVTEGTVFALLGPNGAGKTTLVQIFATLLPPDAGSACVAGHDTTTSATLVRRTIGVTGQFSAVDDLFTGEENLALMADLNHLGRDEGRRRVAELLEQFDLVEAATKPVSAFSGGMKRKLDLAMTLMGRPRVIFLDEPTTGLDPRSRRTMWDVIRRLVADGVTIFLTTQYLDEADQLADHVAVLDGGRLVAVGTPAELKRRIPGGHIRLHFADADQLTAASSAFAEGVPDDLDLTLDVPGDGGVAALRSVLDRLDEQGIEVDELSVHTPDLDDVFLALTGHDRPPAVTGEPDRSLIP